MSSDWVYYRGTRGIYAGKKAIAMVFGPRHPSPEQRAIFDGNGRRIAALPELHIACQQFIDALPTKCYCAEDYTVREKNLGYRFKDPNCLYCELEDEIQYALAAIAKAEGVREADSTGSNTASPVGGKTDSCPNSSLSRGN